MTPQAGRTRASDQPGTQGVAAAHGAQIKVGVLVRSILANHIKMVACRCRANVGRRSDQEGDDASQNHL